MSIDESIDTHQILPKMKFGITINGDLSFTIFCNGLILPNNKVSHLTAKPTIIQYSAKVVAILNFLEEYFLKEKREVVYETISSLLEEVLSCQNLDDEKAAKIQFLSEQFQLLSTTPNGRRYTPSTIALCVMWYKASPILYNQILLDVEAPVTFQRKCIHGILFDTVSVSVSTCVF